MNANDIYPGLEYGYVTYPSRGRRYYQEAYKCRVLHVYKAEVRSSTKRRTLVEIEMEGSNGTTHLRTVSARQIVYSWEEHLQEKQRYEEEQQAREEKQRKRWAEYEESQRLRREQYEREQDEKRRIENEKRQRIYQFFEDRDIPSEALQFTSDSDYIYLHKSIIEGLINAKIT